MNVTITEDMLKEIEPNTMYTTTQLGRIVGCDNTRFTYPISEGKIPATREEGRGAGFRAGYRFLVRGADAVAWLRANYEVFSRNGEGKVKPKNISAADLDTIVNLEIQLRAARAKILGG